jgi:hypothetical protein
VFQGGSHPWKVPLGSGTKPGGTVGVLAGVGVASKLMTVTKTLASYSIAVGWLSPAGEAGDRS